MLMQEHLGKILVGGLFLALLAGRIYFKKPGFTPAESCWRCLWRNACERLSGLWPNWRRGLVIFLIGFLAGGWLTFIVIHLLASGYFTPTTPSLRG